MGRWQPDARDRLERAALELFAEQGFADTTVPQITARAGLTTRTFFRHFTDKREVLFAGEDDVPAQIARLMADAPASLTPMTLIVEGLQTFAATRFEGRREQLRLRRAVIQADESLRERELRKLSALGDALSAGFRDRGVDPLTSTLAAQLAVTVLSQSISRWLDTDSRRPLAELVLETLRALQAVTAELALALPSAGRGGPASKDEPAHR